MSPQNVSMRSRDSISSIPDEILGKILSLLPTRLAASTAVLSKRWRNKLSLVDTLDFSDETGNPDGFSDFVDKTLSSLTSNSHSTLKSFPLSCKHENSRLDSWIRTVLERGFLELHLKSTSMQCIVESHLFTSNTLVKLTLYGGFCFDGTLTPPPGGVFFPNLKTLNLVSVWFWDDNVFERLVSGCPLLDVLLLHYGDPSGSNGLGLSSSIAVSNSSVKRLTVSYRFLAHLEAPDVEVFLTPGLVYFDYSGYVTREYRVDFRSLVEARLDLRSCREERVVGDVSDEDGCYDGHVDVIEYNNHDGVAFGEDDDDDDIVDEDDCEAILNLESSDEQVSDEDDNDSGEDDDDVPDVTDLVAGISNVKTLRLSSESLEVFYFYCKSMPVFHNLLTLSFESDKERGWQVLPLLLNNSPNLETLAIKGLVHKVTDRCGDACVCIAKKKKKKMEEEVCCLSTCQVKVLYISEYGGTRRELRQMRHFLGKLKSLETIKVGIKAKNHEEDDNVNNNYQRITSALTKLPIASSNCQIHFF